MSGVFRGIVGFALGVFLTCTARTTDAATLEWDGPPDCPADAFALKFEQITERRLDEAPDQTLHVSVQREAEGVWTLQVSMAQTATVANSTRTLNGVTCADVSYAAAVAVAMALFEELPIDAYGSSPDVSVADQPADSSGAAEATKALTPSSQVESEPDALQPVVARPWHIPIFALVALDGNLLGEVALGWRVGIALALENWELGISYTGLPSVTKTLDANLNIELQAHTGALTGCYLFGARPVRPLLCANYEAGAVSGEGSGTRLVTKRRRVTFWHALRPEVGLHVALLPALEVRFILGPTFGLNRSEFVLDEGRVAHDVPVFSIRGGAGLAWTF